MGRVLGRALASVANLLGPKRILLFGETLDAYDLFADTMQATFQPNASVTHSNTNSSSSRCSSSTGPVEPPQSPSPTSRKPLNLRRPTCASLRISRQLTAYERPSNPADDGEPDRA